MKKYAAFVLMMIIFACNFYAHSARAAGQVQINEIAWMGTNVSSTKEWIELYNPGNDPVDLSGWKLTAADGSPNIALTGTIPASGYFLLERTSDDTVPGIAANQIYTGSLSNSGENLQLIDATGAVIDTMDASSGWPAGDDSTKHTMQRAGNSWITAAATPGAQNASAGDTTGGENSGASGGSGSNQTGTGSSTNTDDDNDQTNSTTLAQAQSESEAPVKPDPKFSAHLVVPDHEVAGVSVPMSVLVTDNGHRDMVSGRFRWSLGDGSSYNFGMNSPVNHTYDYPGTYTVVVTYYSNLMKEEPDSIHKKTITILPAAISIVKTTNDGGVIIQNDSGDDVDLYGWIIAAHGMQYMLPKYTIVSSGASLSISPRVLGFNAGNSPVLENPAGSVISYYPSSRHAAHIPRENFLDQDAQGSDQAISLPSIVPTAEAAEYVTSTDKPASDFLHDTPWYVWAGIAAIAIGIAYTLIRLYAVSNRGSDLDDLDDADLDSDML